MDLTIGQYGLALGSGGLVGFVLALIGGGGSVLAVPLLLYVVGVPTPHLAIGTSALAVAVNAGANAIPHWRRGTIKLRCAWVFSAFGVVGALIGSTIGKSVDGDQLVAWFGLLMIAVGAWMLFGRGPPEQAEVRLDVSTANRLVPRLGVSALFVGLISGMFGVGGGFLIVPALMLATHMPLVSAIASSSVAVAALGGATAANYAVGGFVDWWLAAALLTGGIVGGIIGAAVAAPLAKRRRVLSIVFSIGIAAAGVAVFAGNI